LIIVMVSAYREGENEGVSEFDFASARGLDNKGFATLRPKGAFGRASLRQRPSPHFARAAVRLARRKRVLGEEGVPSPFFPSTREKHPIANHSVHAF
jgi:hypothetical protein